MIPEPWRSFLTELDETVAREICFHCIGGFVVTQFYGFARPTADVDVQLMVPSDEQIHLRQKAGENSGLHRKYGVYLDFITVASCPINYEARLTEMFPGTFKQIRLFALDPYDLALTKLSRNIQRDRDDVKHLAKAIPFDIAVLQQRYREELRPDVIGNPARHDLTLQLWIEMIEEERGAAS